MNTHGSGTGPASQAPVAELADCPGDGHSGIFQRLTGLFVQGERSERGLAGVTAMRARVVLVQLGTPSCALP